MSGQVCMKGLEFLFGLRSSREEPIEKETKRHNLKTDQTVKRKTMIIVPQWSGKELPSDHSTE